MAQEVSFSDLDLPLIRSLGIDVVSNVAYSPPDDPGPPPGEVGSRIPIGTPVADWGAYARWRGEATILAGFLHSLDVLASYGLKATLAVGGCYFYDNYAQSVRTDFLTSVINACKGHRALHSWYLADEPQDNNPTYYLNFPYQKRIEMYNLIKNLDTQHPVLEVYPGYGATFWPSGDSRTVHYTKASHDIFGIDTYPVYPDGTGGIHPDFASWLQAAAGAADAGDSARFFALQICSMRGGADEPPTGAEIVSMAATARTAGWTTAGIGFWVWDEPWVSGYTYAKSSQSIQQGISTVCQDYHEELFGIQMSASAASSTQFTLNWADSGDSTGITYNLYRNGNQVSANISVGVAQVLTGLANGDSADWDVIGFREGFAVHHASSTLTVALPYVPPELVVLTATMEPVTATRDLVIRGSQSRVDYLHIHNSTTGYDKLVFAPPANWEVTVPYAMLGANDLVVIGHGSTESARVDLQTTYEPAVRYANQAMKVVPYVLTAEGVLPVAPNCLINGVIHTLDVYVGTYIEPPNDMPISTISGTII